MALQVNLIQKPDYLYVEVSGVYEMQDAIYKFPLVISTCRLLGLDKALIDFRQLEGNIAATEKIIYAEGILDHYKLHLSSGGRPLRIAFVGKAPQVSTYEPGIDIANSEGIPFTLTTDLEESLSWLEAEKQ